MRGNDPVIFFEHRAMLDSASARRPYPGDDFVVPFGKARSIAEGNDLTIVTWGAMVHRCKHAEKSFEGRVELIDLRTIAPWDRATVLASVQKTGRVVIVEEGPKTGGVAAELAAGIMEHCADSLLAPVVRVASPDVPVPFAPVLENAYRPDPARIVAAVRRLVAT